MDTRRWLRHLFADESAVRRRFPQATLDAVQAAIRESESHHGGELRFVIEAGLPLSDLWRGLTPRQRALEVFSELRVWDTERNTGVLLYVLLADRDVEIVADRGVIGGDWEAVCREMESRFRAGSFHDGALAGVAAAGAQLQRLVPRPEGARNELADAAVLISR